MEEIIKTIAETIRIERIRKRLSQEKLSELVDITPSYLSNIENGKVNPSIVVVNRIFNALDLYFNITSF